MNNKARLYQLLAIGRQKIGMDEDTYRQLLAQYGGKEIDGKVSAKSMTVQQLEKVLKHLERAGFSVVRSPKRRGHPGAVGRGNNGLIAKVEAQLADMQLPWSYADGIAKQMYGIERVRFCSTQQIKAIIAALYNRQKKEQKQ